VPFCPHKFFESHTIVVLASFLASAAFCDDEPIRVIVDVLRYLRGKLLATWRDDATISPCGTAIDNVRAARLPMNTVTNTPKATSS
jgi:hypothetical protein